MKKVISITTAFLVIGFVIYHSFPNQSHASNNPIEEEYYYNEVEYIEEVTMTNSDTSYKYSDRIDTTPDSLTVLINKDFSLPADYVPADLTIPDIPFSFTSYSEKKMMREEAAAALEALFEAASKEGLNLYGVSGYRSYQRQLAIYNKNIAENGAEHTSQYSAMAGYSEHQSGLAIDVSTISINNRLDVTFGGTPEGRWLAEHCYEYGYIIRYPEGKSDITGYAYEPWHIRYVGKELARELTENNLTFEEYYGYVPSDAVQNDEFYGTAIDVENEDYGAAAINHNEE